MIMRMPLRTTRRTMLRGAALAHVLLLAGCLDFIEPDIPVRSTPANVQVAVRVFDQGSLQIDGSLQPGRDSTGSQRVVQSPFIQVNDLTVQPTALGARGDRFYNTSLAVPPGETGGPFTISFPDVRDVGVLPVVQWNGLLKADTGTIRVARGADIVLRLDTLPLPSTPAPFRQWFLDIRAGGRTFRLSSDGLPPMTLRIPADFIPPSTDTRAVISLIYFQTGQVRSPSGLYNGNVTLDVRLSWVVEFRDAP